MDEFAQADAFGGIRDHIVTQLAKLVAGQEYGNQRLDKINGSVKDLYSRSEENEKNIIAHAGNCPLRGRIEEINTVLAVYETGPDKIEGLQFKITGLEKQIAERASSDRTTAKWWAALQPILLIVGGALISTLITLAFLHSSNIVRAETPTIEVTK